MAQDVDAKIDQFNAAIGETYELSHKGSKLIIEGFREGKKVKTDEVVIHDLDFKSLKYSEEDNSVSVKCYSDLDGCVKRVLKLDRKKSFRNRMVFGIPEGVSGEEIVNRLRLVFNEMAKKY